MVAIGVSNLLGPFLGGYPVTGSFSRTAIKSKAGVRTPFAGVITAVVVLLAIYALPAVFFYVPNALLSAVIIHAVGDLITPPNTVYQFWQINPLEVIIFFVGVIVTVFSSIEDGIYSTICISVAVLLFRVVKARGRFIGRVKVHSVIGDHHVDDSYGKGTSKTTDPDSSTRNIFLPLSHNDGSNPQVDVESPYPGIFMYRFSEGFNYPNANHYLDYMVTTIFQETRRTNPNMYPKLGVSRFQYLFRALLLIVLIGPSMERSGPPPWSQRPRPLRSSNPESDNSRLLLSQQCRHHFRTASYRCPQSARPIHGTSPGRMAYGMH